MSEVLARRQEGGRGEEVACRRHEAGGGACGVLPWVHMWRAMMSVCLRERTRRLESSYYATGTKPDLCRRGVQSQGAPWGGKQRVTHVNTAF